MHNHYNLLNIASYLRTDISIHQIKYRVVQINCVSSILGIGGFFVIGEI